MNSEISTRHPMAPAEGPAVTGAAFRPWHFFVLASLVAATAAVLMAPVPTPEHLILISVTLASAGLVGAAFHKTLLPLFGTNADLTTEPLGRRSRAAIEREKTLVLRSIKELEFDRAMGKVAEEDFNEMATRLRARAITLMKQLDAGTSYREMIERDLARRLPAAAAAAATGRTAGDTVAGTVCSCGTANDPDARFCKKCGAKLGGAA